MANGILETLQEQVALLQSENRTLRLQLEHLAVAVGIIAKAPVELRGDEAPLLGSVLGLVSRGKFVYRPEDAPAIKPTSAKAAADKLLSKELSGDDLSDELEID